MKQIKEKIKNELPEITLLVGLFFIILATFLLNIIAGIYVLGFILSGLGIFLAYNPIKNKKGGDK